MTIQHHPSEETLVRYAAGTLGAGPRLVIAIHLAGCPACRNRIAVLEAVGGALLDEIEPQAMADHALARTLAMIEAPLANQREPSVAAHSAALGIELPKPLRDCEIGPWRWIGPGMRWSRVTLPYDPEADVMMLKVAAGRKLPEHGHTGKEYTHILSGSFSDARGRYFPGDLDEADSEVDHQPIVDRDGECICIAAMDGRMQLRGVFGRILQQFAGR